MILTIGLRVRIGPWFNFTRYVFEVCFQCDSIKSFFFRKPFFEIFSGTDGRGNQTDTNSCIYWCSTSCVSSHNVPPNKVAPSNPPLNVKFWSKKPTHTISHFRVRSSLYFKASLWNENEVFTHMESRTNYHHKTFTQRLALKKKLQRTRKWSILTQIEGEERPFI